MTEPQKAMLDAVLTSGGLLVQILEAENAALEALNMPAAAEVLPTKTRVMESFSAAHQAAMRTGVKVEAADRSTLESLHERLTTLGQDNRRLLERAIGVQSNLIESIAKALPAGDPIAPVYGGRGKVASPAYRKPLTLSADA